MFKEKMHSEGFSVMADVFGADEIARISAKIESATFNRSRAGARHVLGERVVNELATDVRLLGMARQVLGADAFPYRATLFDKSTDSNWLVVWHQDTALPLRSRGDLPGWGPWSVKEGITYAHAPAEALQQVLALRVHVDESNSKNGPLRVLPGTHMLGVLSDDAIEGLVSEVKATECLLDAGGVLAMRPLIVHASSKSVTEMRRRVLHIEYAAQQSFDGLELATA